MDTSSTPARIAGSALAGAVGFLVGFYIGFFLVLSIWGLDAGGIRFVLFTGGLGTLGAGAVIAWTVSSSRKLAAFLTTMSLGLLLVLLVFLVDADAAAMGVGGLVVVTLTSVLVRSGITDAIVR